MTTWFNKMAEDDEHTDIDLEKTSQTRSEKSLKEEVP